MSKFTRKLISPIEPVANASGIYSAVEQLQNLNALAITAVNFCADSSGTANGLNDDTAISTAGGFVKLTGSGFTSASIVYINGISVTKYYLSNTTIVATVPAAVAGTTASLIVFNGSTVGSIWAAGISYSGFPSWTTTAASNLGLVISTQLVAVGDAPLTYTFVSGTLPPNCTISSSGLLSGTVTGVNTNAIYTFTVAVTDAQNQNVSQSIVYTLIVSDFYYRYTSLHITGDSNPTWITDASTNALAVSTLGSPQANTFSPVEPGYYGNSFDGVPGTNINLPANPAYNLSSGQYFIQVFCYPLSGHADISGNSSHSVISQGNNANNLLWALSIIPANGTILWGLSGATVNTSSSYPVLFNAWNHIVISRDASNIERIFLNGKLINQRTNTTNFNGVSDYATRIGSWYDSNYPSAYSISAYGNVFYGYLSNVQIVVGNIPTYFQTSSITLGTPIFSSPTSPPTAVTGTVLLTCQSTRFIDNSTTAATIATSGNPKIVSSNPFNLPAGLAAYGSGYFNGTSYAVSPSNTVFGVGTGDFTIEAWIYPLSWPAAGNYSAIMQISGTSIWFGLNSAGFGLRQGNVGNIISYATNPTLNAWTHVAVARIGTTCTLYYNGVSVATATSSASFAAGAAYIAADETPGNYFAGYISNARLVKGTAVYTAAFIPPTAPLTAVAGTSLLTLQTNVPHNNSQFRDTSTNNALITRYGNTTQGSFSPFTKQYPYSAATVGGSAYFDGTGDYLTLPASSATSFGTKDFTVEFWMNTTGPNSQMLSLAGGTAAGNWQCTLYNGNFYWQSARNTTDTLYVASAGITDSAWHHIAITRASNTLRIFFDGVQKGTVSDATNYNVSSILNIGYSSSYFGGYLSNIRLIAGTAVYTSNFTPSTTPLTAISGTVLLMPFTNAAVYDNTMLNNFETVADAQISTSVFKYGTGALKFNGTTDYLTTSPANQAKFAFGSGDFTIEMWVYATSVSGSRVIYDSYPTSTGGFYPSIQMALSGQIFYNTNTTPVISGGTLSTNTWYHIAVCRSGTSTKLFINGTQSGSTYTDSNVYLNSSLRPYIGASGYTGTGFFPGYIDDLRVTKGIARYTAAFTPDTGAYSASAPFGTSILPSKSLRFRSSASAYLNRTFAAGNRTTWTWSGWIKRGKLGAGGVLFQGYSSIGDRSAFQFNSSDQLFFNGIVGILTTAVFRDPAAWYHMVCVYDSTNATDSNRVILYVNGVRQTVTGTYPTVSQAEFINGAWLHYLSTGYSGAFEYTDGEMAEVNFVDGLALEPTMFGAFSTYGQWLPISYAGYQGANGFYLPFNVGTDTSSVSVNYLAVAGGGGGGTGQAASTVGNGGGGGAGGLLTGTTSLIINNVYPIVIGAGGSAGIPGVNSGSGANSTAFGITATGGGAGGSYNGNAGQTGGSGGGAGYGGIAGAGTSGQGYAGGAGYTGGSPYPAGGGGGAGAVGTNGPGGVGVQSSISGSNIYYAGGGAGGNGSNVTASSGGSGGGGTGGYGTTAGTAGTANLGGGGGGGGNQGTGGTTSSNGAAGGSGVVILSYSGTQKFYGGTVTSSGGNTIHTFTASGALTSVFSDQSGNNNNWTPNNINVSTPGPTYDLLTDVPTLTSATAANYAVLNPLTARGSATATNGNLTYTAAAANDSSIFMTMAVPSNNLIYFELFYSIDLGLGNNSYVGVSSVGDTGALITTGTNLWSYNLYSGVAYNQSSTTTYTAVTNGQTTQYAFDIANGKMWVGANGTWFNSGNPVAGTGAVLTSIPITATNLFASLNGGGSNRSKIDFNFGQRPFAYTPPANFLALNTYNI